MIFSYTSKKKRGCRADLRDTPKLLYLIIFYVPDNRKDDSDGKEDQSRYENTVITLLFVLAELTLAVIGISLVLCSAHREKGEHDVSKNESDTDQRALTTDVQHAGKKRHQYARDEERI